MASVCAPDISAWCAQVTVTPELNKIRVFKNGTSKALNGRIPRGGHIPPISTAGASLLWKKAQKNLKKKNASDVINKAIPQRNPNSTIEAWDPWNDPSKEMSFHQENAIKIRDKTLNNAAETISSENHCVKPRVKFNAAKADIIGQGDSFTRWYGWRIRLEIV